MNAAEFAARACAQPRDFAAIAVDMTEAAIRLRALGDALRRRGPASSVIAEADRTVTGCGVLLRELRRGSCDGP
jgi:hypothetical protein